MKMTISRTALVALIGKIQNVVPTKPSVPILANILLEAVDDQLIISATDLTVSMRAYAEAKVAEEGAITLPARRFFQLIRELTAPVVEIHLSSPDIAAINAGSSHFKIHGMHKNEFPTFPDLLEGSHLCMASHVLKEMLSKTLFAAARDDHRQVLNGICLQHTKEIATFIGTDGKRLAHVHMQLDTPLEQAGSYIVPLKAVDEMVHILDNKEEMAKLTLMQDKIAVEVGQITLIAKLLSGDYPDVGR
ncbi:MAG: DNA polymerase III subunit beta, partial [Chlamydiales bacterium]|nr:DNA polymerase III subunit beta [Chlamydiales bacterium]